MPTSPLYSWESAALGLTSCTSLVFFVHRLYAMPSRMAVMQRLELIFLCLATAINLVRAADIYGVFGAYPHELCTVLWMLAVSAWSVSVYIKLAGLFLIYRSANVRATRFIDVSVVLHDLPCFILFISILIVGIILIAVVQYFHNNDPVWFTMFMFFLNLCAMGGFSYVWFRLRSIMKMHNNADINNVLLHLYAFIMTYLFLQSVLFVLCTSNTHDSRCTIFTFFPVQDKSEYTWPSRSLLDLYMIIGSVLLLAFRLDGATPPHSTVVMPAGDPAAISPPVISPPIRGQQDDVISRIASVLNSKLPQQPQAAAPKGELHIGIPATTRDSFDHSPVPSESGNSNPEMHVDPQHELGLPATPSTMGEANKAYLKKGGGNITPTIHTGMVTHAIQEIERKSPSRKQQRSDSPRARGNKELLSEATAQMEQILRAGRTGGAAAGGTVTPEKGTLKEIQERRRTESSKKRGGDTIITTDGGNEALLLHDTLPHIPTAKTVFISTSAIQEIHVVESGASSTTSSAASFHSVEIDSK